MQSFENKAIVVKEKARHLFRNKKYDELIEYLNREVRTLEEMYYLSPEAQSSEFRKMVFTHKHSSKANKVYGALTSIKLMRYIGHYAKGDKLCAENSIYLWPFLVIYGSDNIIDFNLMLDYYTETGDQEQLIILLYHLQDDSRTLREYLGYNNEIDNFIDHRSIIGHLLKNNTDLLDIFTHGKNSSRWEIDSLYTTRNPRLNQYLCEEFEFHRKTFRPFFDIKLLGIIKDVLYNSEDLWEVNLFNFIYTNMNYMINHDIFGEQNRMLIGIFMFLTGLRKPNKESVNIFNNYLTLLKSVKPELNTQYPYLEELFNIHYKLEKEPYSNKKPELVEIKL